MKALILVDIQTDFLPGGALAVPNGDKVIPVANQLQAAFPLVVVTQDWHPADHGSFAANHPGKKVFEQIDLNGLPQTLWPVHCVQGTPGAELAPGLQSEGIAKIFTKGTTWALTTTAVCSITANVNPPGSVSGSKRKASQQFSCADWPRTTA